MSVQDVDYSQFLRRVRNRTYNKPHHSVTLWLTREEHVRLKALAEEQGTKPATIAVKAFRAGIKEPA